ncbi:MAG: metal-dependent transcriptional regulator [Chloroflexi bacterium]|nr:metal-dependent transcriptional regulator [Chloroflexota bacterium]
MMTNHLTQNIQDYLKAIYSLSFSGNAASTNALAVWLGVTPASVTGMLQKMATSEPPLVIYQKHRGARLSLAGERAALEVLRHHRLLETWLVERLGYSWDAVHEEACRLEHVISEEFEQRIDESLGHPVRDPHGAPIPSAELVMPRFTDVPLSNLEIGARAIVRRVVDEDREILQVLQQLGLMPGVVVEMLGHVPGTGDFLLRVLPGNMAPFRMELSRHLMVEVIERNMDA